MRTLNPGHRVRTTLREDGKLSLDHLPFRSGDDVDVTVIPALTAVDLASHPLRGSVLFFDRPAEPVAEEEWSVSL
ncbi:MAG: hypothetical protein EXS09_00865 [Gemmataceae bacterium]|nr:hypothetical protein [Gemmataceae bacterium]